MRKYKFKIQTLKSEKEGKITESKLLLECEFEANDDKKANDFINVVKKEYDNHKIFTDLGEPYELVTL